MLDAGMPISRYQNMSDFNKIQDRETLKWMKDSLPFKMPTIWPSYGKVKTAWGTYKQQFDINPIERVKGGEWPICGWWRYVLTCGNYTRHTKQLAHNKIEVLEQGDGFKTLGGKACFLIASIANFNLLSKCVNFNFLINLALVEED